MKKEMMYIAPEAEILVAQVEKGFIGSETGNAGESDGDESW